MGNFDPVDFKSLVQDPNTFGRPRQKMWGVFIISGYTESPGTLVPLNFSVKGEIIPEWEKQIYAHKEGISDHYFRATRFQPIGNYTPLATPPDEGPEGEVIVKYEIKNALKLGAVSTGSFSGYYGTYDIYANADIIGDATLYYYNEIVKTISWDLVLLTPDIHKAKDKLNDWLRAPEVGSGSTARPKIGIDSVMICEIIPSDSVIEL
jgi:hypothetical protein